MTALGFVHIVGSDQEGKAFGGQSVNLFPKFSARFRINTGRRLIQEQ